ncbi:hypothetical protein FRC11_002794 [Ceratobasidium sp. 423]|nr:hypothetical protein FRC11_002794 [Ceratobasidium sp. 423]
MHLPSNSGGPRRNPYYRLRPNPRALHPVLSESEWNTYIDTARLPTRPSTRKYTLEVVIPLPKKRRQSTRTGGTLNTIAPSAGGPAQGVVREVVKNEQSEPRQLNSTVRKSSRRFVMEVVLRERKLKRRLDRPSGAPDVEALGTPNLTQDTDTDTADRLEPEEQMLNNSPYEAGERKRSLTNEGRAANSDHNELAGSLEEPRTSTQTSGWDSSAGLSGEATEQSTERKSSTIDRRDVESIMEIDENRVSPKQEEGRHEYGEGWHMSETPSADQGLRSDAIPECNAPQVKLEDTEELNSVHTNPEVKPPPTD